MDWLAQNAALLKIWGEAQTQLFDAWGSIAQRAQTPFTRTPSPFASAMLDASTDAIRQGIRAMAFDADPTAREAAEKLFISQTSVIRLLEMTLRIWGSLLPVLQAGGDWHPVLREQMNWVRTQTLQAATQGLRTAGSYQQLWTAFLEDSQLFGKPWLAEQEAHPNGGDLAWEAYQKTFGELVTLPATLWTRELDDGLRLAFAAWIELQQALYDYNAILSETWCAAFEQFMRDLIRLLESGEMLESVRDLLNRWSAVADNSFKLSFVTDGYIRAQARLTQTTAEYRKCQQQVNERVMHMFDLPTRTEIDEAHRRIHELRKEMRALKREVAALKAQIEQKDGQT
jgi:class III poly(R)-hydroxyalkanoic acid synthase PhaE subunit